LVAFEKIGDEIKNDKNAAILLVTQKGMGKRTLIEQYPIQKRSGLGVKVGDITAKTGKVASIRLITSEHKELVISTEQGQTIKLANTRKALPILTRPTQGVILMKMQPDDKVATTALTNELDSEEDRG